MVPSARLPALGDAASRHGRQPVRDGLSAWPHPTSRAGRRDPRRATPSRRRCTARVCARSPLAEVPPASRPLLRHRRLRELPPDRGRRARRASVRDRGPRRQQVRRESGWPSDRAGPLADHRPPPLGDAGGLLLQGVRAAAVRVGARRAADPPCHRDVGRCPGPRAGAEADPVRARRCARDRGRRRRAAPPAAARRGTGPARRRGRLGAARARCRSRDRDRALSRSEARDAGVEMLERHAAIGIYEGPLVPLVGPDELARGRGRRGSSWRPARSRRTGSSPATTCRACGSAAARRAWPASTASRPGARAVVVADHARRRAPSARDAPRRGRRGDRVVARSGASKRAGLETGGLGHAC